MISHCQIKFFRLYRKCQCRKTANSPNIVAININIVWTLGNKTNPFLSKYYFVQRHIKLVVVYHNPRTLVQLQKKTMRP